MERAPRSIQLVADLEPLEVVAEDDKMLVVNKPYGVRSTPVHRFQGNNMLSRMIGHLGCEPHLLHRCRGGEGIKGQDRDQQQAWRVLVPPDTQASCGS